MADYTASQGTGTSPFILPEGSVAADRLLNTIDYNQQIDAANRKNRLAAAQQLANSYKENAFKAKNGILYNNELMALQQKHVQQGADYAKQGFDIYNPNPNNASQMAAHEQYIADRAKLMNYQDVRDELSKAKVKTDEEIAKSEPGRYNVKDIQAHNDFFSNNTLHDIVSNGLQVPQVREAFDPQKHLLDKIGDTVAMTPETEYVNNGHRITTKMFKPVATSKNIEQLITNAPGGVDYVQEQTGLTPQQAHIIPNTLQDITKLNDGIFRSTPQGQQALVQAGITSYEDPKYQQLLTQKSQLDFTNKQRYNKVIDNYVNAARAKAHEVNKNLPDYTAEDQAWDRESRAHQRQEWEKKDDTADITFGNQESQVPVLKVTTSGGKIVPQQVVGTKGKMTTVNSTVEPEQGATLFTQNFPQTKVIATPGTVISLKNGHAAKNTEPFEVTAGQVKMEPVFTGLNGKDSRNGAVMSKRQLQEIVEGKHKDFTMANISFQPVVYGSRPVKNSQGKTDYEPVAFPFDAVRGNKKIDTKKFEQVEQQFHTLMNSPQFKALDAKSRLDFLQQYFKVQ